MSDLNRVLDVEEMILTYVPEAAWIDFESALGLAVERDILAAYELEQSILNVDYYDIDKWMEGMFNGNK